MVTQSYQTLLRRKVTDMTTTTSTTPAASAPSGATHISPAPAPAAAPGGMASDPVAALANEIVTNIKGAPDRFKAAIESTPALKSLMENADESLTASVAQTIRTFVNAEVAKVTGGLTPKPAAGAATPAHSSSSSSPPKTL